METVETFYFEERFGGFYSRILNVEINLEHKPLKLSQV